MIGSFTSDGRLYSADGNLKLHYFARNYPVAEENDEIIFGQGFHSRPVVFDNFITRVDGLNEN